MLIIYTNTSIPILSYSMTMTIYCAEWHLNTLSTSIMTISKRYWRQCTALHYIQWTNVSHACMRNSSDNFEYILLLKIFEHDFVCVRVHVCLCAYPYPYSPIHINIYITFLCIFVSFSVLFFCWLNICLALTCGRFNVNKTS